VDLLAGAAIPAMLLVLGFQLGEGIRWGELPSLSASMFLRLVVAAPLAYLATVVLGLGGVAQQAVIIVAAMPTAVFTIILAGQFGANPRFITTAVVASTLASIGTLTVVVTLVQNRLG
jgi:predicted permease